MATTEEVKTQLNEALDNTYGKSLGIGLIDEARTKAKDHALKSYEVWAKQGIPNIALLPMTVGCAYGFMAGYLKR